MYICIYIYILLCLYLLVYLLLNVCACDRYIYTYNHMCVSVCAHSTGSWSQRPCSGPAPSAAASARSPPAPQLRGARGGARRRPPARVSACVYDYTDPLMLYIYVDTYVYLHTCIHAYSHTYMLTCICTHMRTYVRTYLSICTHFCSLTHACVYLYMQVHTSEDIMPRFALLLEIVSFNET